ncbi:MAG: hypothetical protein ACXW2I_14170 [Burkholderiales bacterium]
MRLRTPGRDERPLSAVPRVVKYTLVGALGIHVIWQALAPAPSASASALRPPPALSWLRAASLGEPIAFSQLLTLYLQAFDNQPGVSIPFARLDYNVVIAWLEAALELDPKAQYPLMMASQVYAQVNDETKQRRMLEFVHREFLRDPDRRWRWLAHAAIVAKHRLRDMPLALRYAEDIARYAGGAQSWARQMRIFLLEDMGEREAAAVLLGGLLESGEVKDANEIRFLMQRLDELKYGDKSSIPSKFR